MNQRFSKLFLSALFLSILLQTQPFAADDAGREEEKAAAAAYFVDRSAEPAVPHGIQPYQVQNIVRKHFDIIGSTQTLTYGIIDDAFKNDNTKLKEVFGTERIYEDQVLLITATEQNAGIGHNGRSWQSPPGNLYATFTFPWPENKQNLFQFAPQVTNLSVCQTVKTFGFSPQFKWINDMLLNHKKSAGVLLNGRGGFTCYNHDDEPSFTNYVALVVGIGINVNMNLEVATERFESLNDIMKMPFTSMAIESGKEFDVESVLAELNKNLFRNFTTLLRDQDFGSSFLPEISSMLAYVGQEVEYKDDGAGDVEPRRVIFEGIKEDGQIVLRDGEEQITKLSGRIRPIFQ